MDLRCRAKLHGVVFDNQVLEVKCKSQFCGAGPGIVVIHKFDLHTGAVETVKYKEPPLVKEGRENGDCNDGPAVRSA
jgi:hypothetical protein